MKQPVEPEEFKRRHLRNQYALKAVGWSFVLIVITSVYGGMLWAVWGSGYPDIFTITLLIGGTLAAFLGAIPFFSLLKNADSAIDYHHSYKSLINLNAWNAQQEELKRLQDLLKEDGL